VHRIERPVTRSYALVPVEIKQKGTVHVGEKSVCGVEVWRGALASEETVQEQWQGLHLRVEIFNTG
jgi:hypothetical protein